MKRLNQFFAVLVFLMFSTAFTEGPNNPNDVEQVKQVIQDYIKSTDTRDVSSLEKILYPTGNYYNYNKVTNKASEMSNDQFLEKIKQGQTGGWQRQLNINSVDVNDNTAMAKVEITDSRLKQHGYLTLIKDDGNWKIITGAFSLETSQ